MKILLYIFGLLLIGLSCSQEPYECSCNTTEVSKNDSILNSQEAINGLPKFLARYNQESLSMQNNESYRLSTTDSFNKFHQVYTLTKTKEGGDFIIQEYLRTKPHTDCGKISNEHRSTISAAEWKSFKKVIEDNCFWTLPIEDPDDGQYLDGGEWYIEGFQPETRNCSNSEYLITFRKLPSTSKRFYNVFTSMMEMVNQNEIHQTE